jgi:hypothetical protein
MSAEDLLGLLVPATYLYFLLTESPWPARSFPPRKGWQWLGVGFLLLMMTIGTVLPLALPVDWLATHRLLDGTRLGVVGGAIVGYVVLEGVIYAWHRSVHTFFQHWTVRTPQWLAAMLAFRDVNAEFYPAGSLGQQAAQRPSNA